MSLTTPSLIPQIPPPPLGSSVNYDTNFTQNLETPSLESLEITDGQVILSDGFLSNLNNPVADTDIATKDYVDTFSGGGSSVGPSGAIQFNRPIGAFDGTAELIWDGSSIIITAVGSIITDGVSNINGGFLHNLSDPVLNQDGATKNYVDSKGSEALTEISVDSPGNTVVTITASQMVNKVVNRQITGLGVGIGTDGFETADVILAYIRANVDSTADLGYSFTTIVRYIQSQQLNYIVELTTPGSGYTAGSKLTLPDPGMLSSPISVLITVGGSGEILTAVVDSIGSSTFYSIGDVLTVVGGDGLGTVTLTNTITIPQVFISGNASAPPNIPPTVEFSPLANFGNFPAPVLSPDYKNVIPFKFVFTNVTPGEEVLVGYVSNNSTLIPTGSSSVTDQGLLAKSLYVNDIVIYPTIPTDYTLDGPVTYTYPDLEKNLIIRGGSLTGSVSDTFDTVATMIANDVFAMGSGTFKFFLQNIDPTFDVTLTASAGWTMDPASDMTIGAGKTGVFLVSVNTVLVTARIFSVGIFVRDGV